METIYTLLQQLRLPMQSDEYALHRQVLTLLECGGISCEHEYRLLPRCRIDIFCPESGTGIELKRGKPDRTTLLKQLGRYAESEQITGIILIAERSVDLPRTIHGKPLRLLCLNRLWGIAL